MLIIFGPDIINFIDSKYRRVIIMETTVRKGFRFITLLKWGAVTFLMGCCVGIHRKVIKALITGGQMPVAPSWHFWCRSKGTEI